jgi:hypothetical protein
MLLPTAYDNRYRVTVARDGRWITIAYADHEDEALEVANKARKHHPGVRISQGEDVLESFGEAPRRARRVVRRPRFAAKSKSLLGPNPRVVVDLDNADLARLEKQSNELLQRVDKLTAEIGRSVKMGAIAFTIAGVLALLVLMERKRRQRRAA